MPTIMADPKFENLPGIVSMIQRKYVPKLHPVLLAKTKMEKLVIANIPIRDKP